MNKKAAKNNSIVKKPENEVIKIKKTKIRVIGIGGGGCSIVSEIASKVKKASFVAANTDKKALRGAKRGVIRFQFGENFTHGLGTGMNKEIGEAAALAEKEKIKKLFEGQDLCVIIACLGGGTGSGAAQVFAKMAKSAGCLTYGIFTLPFNFEGEKKAIIARESLEDLRPKLHAFSVMPNERIFQIIKKETPLGQALSAINGRLAAGLEGLIEIIYEPGLINIDFADLKTVLEGQGRLTYLNTALVSKKEGAIPEAIEKLLNSPLYPYTIRGAKGVLYNIAGEKSLTLSEVNQISKTISGLVNPEAKIIFGISQSQKYGGSIKTTLLATGCGTKIFSNEKPIKVKKHPKKKIFLKKEKDEDGGKKDSAESQKKGSRNKNNKKIKRFRKPAREKIQLFSENKGKSLSKKEKEKKEIHPVSSDNKAEAVVRKNALQIKKEADEVEAEMLAREKFWETPAFLRRKRVV